MNKQNSDWEAAFDKQFEGYWRGDAIPDEIKFFISRLLETEREKILELMERRTGLMRYSSFRGLLEEVQALRPASKDITQISEK